MQVRTMRLYRVSRGSLEAVALRSVLMACFALGACGDTAPSPNAIASASATALDAGVSSAHTPPVAVAADAAPPPSAVEATPPARLANGVAGRSCAVDAD